MLTISPIPAFSDNYIWLIQSATGEAFVVDPGDPEPVLRALEAAGLNLEGILITHHHPDHTGGLLALKQATHCEVWGPDNPKIRGIDNKVCDGDRIDVLGTVFSVLAVPGHTLDHLAYIAQDVAFVGDTLFAGGCGRLFEGTPAMMRHSLEKLLALPDDSKIYCAHEYTQANLRFAAAADEGNVALRERGAEVDRLRRDGMPTVPTTIGVEKATNPFLRWSDPAIVAHLKSSGRLSEDSPDAVFGALRQWKDQF